MTHDNLNRAEECFYDLIGRISELAEIYARKGPSETAMSSTLAVLMRLIAEQIAIAKLEPEAAKTLTDVAFSNFWNNVITGRISAEAFVESMSAREQGHLQ